MNHGFEHAASELEKVVARSLRLAPIENAPLLAWPVVCGSAVAQRTRAVNFQEGVLQVEVPDPAWKAELLSLAPRYLAAMNRYTSAAVRRIEFVLHAQDKRNPMR